MSCNKFDPESKIAKSVSASPGKPAGVQFELLVQSSVVPAVPFHAYVVALALALISNHIPMTRPNRCSFTIRRLFSKFVRTNRKAWAEGSQESQKINALVAFGSARRRKREASDAVLEPIVDAPALGYQGRMLSREAMQLFGILIRLPRAVTG
ncbi:MAG: hypothetical protein JNL18_03145 [Planctomycetaceae bacterium]|nr:hypothetical protein [Planctomycetaceae bacterium]